MSKINWWNLQLGTEELSFLQSAFNQKKISYNSVGQTLEAKLSEFLGVKHVLVCTSGSTALLMALKAIGIGPRDEVIVPNRTFQATANAVLMAGAKVKLVDVDPTRATLNVTLLESALTSRTKAVIPVHLNGRACEITEIQAFCRSHNLKLIEDAAQAFHSKYKGKPLGTFGDFGCFSMGTTKFLTTGQGGFLVTDDSDLYQEAKKFIFQGFQGDDDKKFDSLGFNFRLSDLLSSLALSQMNNLEAKRQRFLNVYNFYQNSLSKLNSVQILECRVSEGETPIWVEALSPQRDRLFQFLKARGIEGYKFYPSLHRSSYLENTSQPFPNSTRFENNGLILPCGPDITMADCERVVTEIIDFEKTLPV